MCTDTETWKSMYQTLEVGLFLETGGSRENFHSGFYVFRPFSDMYINSSSFFYCGKIQNTYNKIFILILNKKNDKDSF